jgi:hypothetical protein
MVLGMIAAFRWMMIGGVGGSPEWAGDSFDLLRPAHHIARNFRAIGRQEAATHYGKCN